MSSIAANNQSTGDPPCGLGWVQPYWQVIPQPVVYWPTWTCTVSFGPEPTTEEWAAWRKCNEYIKQHGLPEAKEEA